MRYYLYALLFLLASIGQTFAQEKASKMLQEITLGPQIPAGSEALSKSDATVTIQNGAPVAGKLAKSELVPTIRAGTNASPALSKSLVEIVLTTNLTKTGYFHGFP